MYYELQTKNMNLIIRPNQLSVHNIHILQLPQCVKYRHNFYFTLKQRLNVTNSQII